MSRLRICKKWTEKEINLLKEFYLNISSQELQKLFPNRTIKSIYGKAYCLNITKKLGLDPKIRFDGFINKNSDIFGEDGKYPTECWVWVGGKDKDGYGLFCVLSKIIRAHRFSYEIHKESISPGLVIDHLCRRTDCVNPDHLEVVTPKENVNRGSNYNRDKIRCSKNHLYDEKNTYFIKGRGRGCRICKRERDQKYQKNKKHVGI